MPNDDNMLNLDKILYTVGHSNYPIEVFIELVRKQQIEVIADVRSNPYAKYATHFTGQFLKKSLETQGLKYVFLGKEIGGKPKEPEFYDNEGHANFEKLAASAKFADGMERLELGISKYRVAIMCAEENPIACHRHLLIAKAAHKRGWAVGHIRKNGQIQNYESYMRETSPEILATQLNLFAGI